MRVTNEMTYNMLKSNIMRVSKGIYDLQEQASSGKRLQAPSNDPSSYDAISRLEEDKARLTQFSRNAESLNDELLEADGLLQGVIDILHRGLELTVEASDATKTPVDRQAMAKEVDLLLEGLVDLANSNPGGRYLFAGLRTDTAAYALTRDADGMITDITYQGNTGVRQVEIGQGFTIDANLPGSDFTGEKGVFQTATTDVFSGLMQLRDRLLAGENPVEPEEITADAGSDILTVGKTYRTGSMVSLATDGTLPGGLTAGQTYYAIKVSDTEIRLAATLADARAGIFIDITDAGTGTHSLTQQSLREINEALEQVLRTEAVVGARQERISLNDAIIGRREIAAENSLESLQGVDVAEVVMELSKRQVAYEAALRVTAGTLQDTLVNML
ncbi:MAG: flagellar hook-associated protein FlgL [Kiritimatiellae bacterium]|nr:flagellar hook-associated protein FlgL [Kiritimatiellia bacterium]